MGRFLLFELFAGGPPVGNPLGALIVGGCLGVFAATFALDQLVTTRKRRRGAPWARRILYIQFTNPAAYPPLQHSSRILADAGWDVRMLGTESSGSHLLRFPSHPRIRLTKLPFRPGMAFRKLRYCWFCIRALWDSIWGRASWIYASDIRSYPPALLVSLLTGKRVILHEHDSPARQHTGFTRLLLFARTWLARRAVLNILPNRARAQTFREQTGAHSVKVVWNCPSLAEIPESAGPPHEGFVLYYHGNISSALLPLSVVEALKLLPQDVGLHIIGYETLGQVGYIDKFTETAARLGVAHRVSIRPPVSRFELFSLSRQADLGLALFPVPAGSADSYAGASNKVFDYLCCGMPVLVTDSTEWNSFFSGEGCSLPCNPADPWGISQAVLKLYHDRDLARAMGQRGKNRILAGWNYEAQFTSIFEILQGKCETS